MGNRLQQGALFCHLETKTMKNIILISIFLFCFNYTEAQKDVFDFENYYKNIDRIVIKNDSVISFYSLDSINLNLMKDYLNKLKIEDIDKELKCHCDSSSLNYSFYIYYCLTMENNQKIYCFSNYPLYIFDSIFIWSNIFYNGKLEDSTYSIDFWRINISESEIESVPYNNKSLNKP